VVGRGDGGARREEKRQSRKYKRTQLRNRPAPRRGPHKKKPGQRKHSPTPTQKPTKRKTTHKPIKKQHHTKKKTTKNPKTTDRTKKTKPYTTTQSEIMGLRGKHDSKKKKKGQFKKGKPIQFRAKGKKLGGEVNISK